MFNETPPIGVIISSFIALGDVIATIDTMNKRLRRVIAPREGLWNGDFDMQCLCVLVGNQGQRKRKNKLLKITLNASCPAAF